MVRLLERRFLALAMHQMMHRGNVTDGDVRRLIYYPTRSCRLQSELFAKTLVEKFGRSKLSQAAEKLGLAPGSAFGGEGEGWLRWCLAADPVKIEDGLGRLAAYLQRRSVGEL